MTNVIDQAMMEAKQFLHRTRDPGNPHRHKATVCIICDRFIIGTETIHKLTKECIVTHTERLGVKSYEEYYQTTLKAKVKRQYQVQGLHDMLLSPRSRKYPDGYTTCSVCYTGMQPQMASKKNPPKFAIAYGFVIGCFPQVVKKDDAKHDGLKAANEDNLNVVVDKNSPHVPLPLVVSPPSAPNLTSFLTGHIGQEVGMQAADNGIATDKGSNTQEDKQVDDN